MKIIFRILLCLSLIGCTDYKKEKKEELKQCYNDKNIKFKYDSLSFRFIKENVNLKNAEIYHVSNGEQITLANRIDEKNFRMKIKNPISLKSSDTIVIRLKNGRDYKLCDFKNIANYGGKNFLGCSLGEYKFNGEKFTLTDGSILPIN